MTQLNQIYSCRPESSPCHSENELNRGSLDRTWSTSSSSSAEKALLAFFLGDLILSLGLQSLQNQSPFGTAFSFGLRQYMWWPRSQPSHSSMFSGSVLRRQMRHLVLSSDLKARERYGIRCVNVKCRVYIHDERDYEWGNFSSSL